METVVLIHGYGFDQRIWSPIELAFEGHRVIRFSLPGFGHDDPVVPYTIGELARRFWESLESNQNDPVHLVGHSMGGYVAIEMAAQRPGMVSGLALIHSHVFEDGPEKKKQRTATMESIREYGAAPLAKKMVPSLFAPGKAPDEVIHLLIRRALAYPADAWYYGAQAMRDRGDHSDTLKSLTIPVLLVAGDKDGAVPLELFFKMAALTERCVLKIYAGTGHMAMYENGPELITDLSRFYND